MTSFERILLRLKERLGVQTDKEIAELLGMSNTAFNARKKRDAFPQDKLLAMMVRRQDIDIDVEYVLSGSSPETRERDRRLGAVRHGAEAALRVEGLTRRQQATVLDEVARAEIGTLAKDELLLVDHYRSADDDVKPVILAAVASMATAAPHAKSPASNAGPRRPRKIRK